MKPLGRPSEVLLVGIGQVRSRLLADVGQAVRTVLAVSTRAGPSLDRPEYAFNKERGQYHAPAVVRRLASLRSTARGAPVIGVADVDLFVPDQSHVLVEADRDAGAAVLSLARLATADVALYRRRAQTEAIHAAAQLLGLTSCGDWRCAMFQAEEASDTDRKSPALCASCRSALGLP